MDDELTGSGWTMDRGTRAAMRLDRVRTAMRHQEWQTAIVEVEEFLDEEPQHPEALFLLGESLLEIGDAALACEVYEDHVKLTNGVQPAALLGLAVARFETCDLPGAIEAAREVVRVEPDNGEAHFTLGLAMERSPGRSVEAIASLSAAARLEPEMFSFPLEVPTEDWSRAVGDAVATLPTQLQHFWSGVPMHLEAFPDLVELRRHSPPLPPTITALYVGEPPDDPEDGRRPEAVRLFTRNLARVPSWDDLVEQIALALQQEALDWLGLTAEEL